MVAVVVARCGVLRRQSSEAIYSTGLGGMHHLSGSSPDDCGYEGVRESTCLRRGCEWKPQKKQGEPWCRYHPTV